ncbi:MAG: hypothetical protein M1831_004957 [Alyxoria varia]|nr:MAG: hypothetical protein M1831_004957 [Alyxoria varia]
MTEEDAAGGLDNMAEEQLQPRAYQLEMLEESMKRNIIVVMDTGSGKTHVAVLRVQEELKRCAENKRIWFIAPKVALAEQQHKVLKESIPGVQHRLLTGNDGVDKWTDQRVWDVALNKQRVVVSTPQCLLDALTHGFVQLGDFSLLVVDEAHHCTGSAPVKEIMRGFYYQAINQGVDRPSILGLTASPVTKSKPEDISKLERALDATVCTPRKCRSDLLQFSNRPETRPVFYVPSSVVPEHVDLLEAAHESRNSSTTFSAQVNLPDTTPISHGLWPASSTRVLALEEAMLNYDFSQDPYVRSRMDSTVEALEFALERKSIQRKTFCSKALKSLHRKAIYILRNLGAWAADWFIEECTNRLRGYCDDQALFLDWSTSEKKHLLKILVKTVAESAKHEDLKSGITDKVEKLLGMIGKGSEAKQTGIIFAKTRADVACLAQIISTNPATSDLRVGTFVGTSTRLTRKSEIADLADLKQQQDDLKAFRNGQIDLIIATTVLEEGIDVPRCNLVIAFDKPDNLRSFIQRRGRARDASSRYMIFLPRGEMRDWEGLEQELVKKYLEEDRTRAIALAQESIEEDSQRSFRVEETNALLTPQNAITHLYNFCHSLRGSFTNLNPVFSTIELSPGLPNTLLSARVDLPLSVHPDLRIHKSMDVWQTEKAAKRDAAFCAYLALYHAGLVNKNLLPIYDKVDEDLESADTWEDRAATAKVRELADPWTYVVQKWEDKSHTLYASKVVTEVGGKECNDLGLLLPMPLPQEINTKLFWNENMETSLSIRPPAAIQLSSKELFTVRRASQLLLNSVYQKSIDQSRTDFMALFIPNMLFAQLEEWTEHFGGSRPAREIASLSMHSTIPSFLHQVLPDSLNADTCGLVRDQTLWGARYIAKRFVETIPTLDCRYSKDETPGIPQERQLCVEAIKLPKRRDFLHALPNANSRDANPSYTTPKYIPIDNCTVDNLPATFSILTLFIPSITHVVSIQQIADQLRRTLLAPVGITDLSLVVSSICASSADEQGGDYQRLEFLGDDILKFLVSLQLMGSKPHWPESYLTAKKSRMVSNKTLSDAAVAVGLDKFIVTQRFTGAKWKPQYVSGESPTKHETREMSTKILADVVEALIGAAYLDGAKSGLSSLGVEEPSPSSRTPNLLNGLSKALECIKLFYPRTHWIPFAEMQSHIQSQARHLPVPPGQATLLSQPESLVGHTFKNKSLLLTALTHPSYNVAVPHDTSFSEDDSAKQLALESYQRLEFLGDAILDFLVTTTLFEFRDARGKELPHHDLHHFREALVNGSFLAFLCLENCVSEERTDVQTRVVPRKRKSRGETHNATAYTEDTTTDGAEAAVNGFQHYTTASASTTNKDGKHSNFDVEISTQKTHIKRSLPHFMQRDTMSADFAMAQSRTERLHAHLRESILDAFFGEATDHDELDGGVGLAQSGAPGTSAQPPQSPIERSEANQKEREKYPWAHLSQLHAPKHLSDIIESCIAAVWLDSAGDLYVVRKTLETIGLTRYTRVMLGQSQHDDDEDEGFPISGQEGRDEGKGREEWMDVLHPKESLGLAIGTLNKGLHHTSTLNLRVRYESGVVGDGDGSSTAGRDIAFRENGEGVPRGNRTCTLYVGDTDVARVEGAFSRLEAETRVAEVAVREFERGGGSGWMGLGNSGSDGGGSGLGEVESAARVDGGRQRRR